MSGINKVIIGVVIAILLVGSLAWGFWSAGGKSLIGIYQNYLSQDLPDKKYSWDNFKDRGPREMLSGYYAGSDSSGFYMWTLSGLKQFIASILLCLFPLSSFLIQS